jgi:hypothetical protein
MVMRIVDAVLEPLPRRQQSGCKFLTGGTLLLAIGAVGWALSKQQLWGKVLTGMGAGSLGVGLALCCWGPARAPVPAPQVEPPPQPPAPVQAQAPQPQAQQPVQAQAAPMQTHNREGHQQAARWIFQFERQGPATTEGLQQELLQTMAECDARRQRHDPHLRGFMDGVATGMARRYVLATDPTGTENGRMLFFTHVAAVPELRDRFVHNRPGLLWNIHHAIGLVAADSGEVGDRLLYRTRLLRATLDGGWWNDTSELVGVRTQLAAFQVIRQISVWFRREDLFRSKDPDQGDLARELAEILRIARPALWPEGSALGEASGDRVLDFLAVHTDVILRDREQAGVNREQAILHQADCLAMLLRLVNQDGALPRAATGLARFAQLLVDRWRQHEETALARLDQGETGLLEQIAAVMETR